MLILNVNLFYAELLVVIELLSAIEIKSLGFDINIENYSENLPEGYQEPIYSIAPNGNLMQFHKSLPTK